MFAAADEAWKFGDFRNCDPPSWTVDGLMKSASEQKIDFIFYTGTFRVVCTNVDQNLIANQCEFSANVCKMVRKTELKSRFISFSTPSISYHISFILI